MAQEKAAGSVAKGDGAARERRLRAIRHVGPNWYAVVMGTAIVPGAGVALAHQFPGSLYVWQAVAALAFLELLLLLIARGLHWACHADQARAHLLDPTMAPFYAAAAMAFLAVGLVSYTVGHTLLPDAVAILLCGVLWSIGTVIGIVSSVGLLVLMVVRHELQVIGQSPAWLLPPMGTMVSAAFAFPLLDHLAAGQGRALLTLGLYALLGLDLVATIIVFPLVMQRLFVHGEMPLRLTPLLFLGIAPFGQAVNALNNLADTVPGSALPEPFGKGFVALGLVGGVPIMGFTLFWAAVCLVLLVRGLRRGLTFSMTWWSIPFAWGTLVTGSGGLYRHSGIDALSWFAVGCFVLLCVFVLFAWPQTLYAVLTRRLPAPPPTPTDAHPDRPHAPAGHTDATGHTKATTSSETIRSAT